MQRTNSEIIASIRELLNELEGAGSGVIQATTASAIVPKANKKLSGCSGAIQGLIHEGFLNDPKDVTEIVDRLKQEGQPYSKELISMNLLNLVKPPRKVLRRIDENKRWKYIVRT